MVNQLENKVAIVTGAASGIGRAICKRFLLEGAKVVIADRNTAGAEETRRIIKGTETNSTIVPVDIAHADQVQNLISTTTSHFGKLDILVNGAAILIRTPPLTEVDEVDWDLTMDTNLKGSFFCCKYAIPAMIANNGGSIVNIASVAGIRGIGYSVPYAISKAGLMHLTTVAASQYTSQGIRINCVAPGPVDTPQMRGSTASSQGFESREQSHPMGRVGSPDEIANLILWLASDEASYVSGSTYLIDGGSWASAG